MINLGDVIHTVHTIDNIYTRFLGEKKSISFLKFVEDNPGWPLYEVRYIQSDNNDIILELIKPL